MIDIITQKKGEGFYPYSQEDREAAAEIHQNQLSRAKLTSIGATKQYHIEQLAKFMIVCGKVADNTEIPGWTTKKNVAFQCKVGLHFVDTSATAVSPDGWVQFKYRSISLSSMKYLESCDFFRRAYDFMADKMGWDVAELTRDDREPVDDPSERGPYTK